MPSQAKRPRSSSAAPSSEEKKATVQNDAPPRPVPHESIWFEDGNIVLSTDVHLYRVHKGIRVKQSSVFNDKFRTPEPEEGHPKSTSESWNGVPLVNMVGDRDEDVK